MMQTIYILKNIIIGAANPFCEYIETLCSKWKTVALLTLTVSCANMFVEIARRRITDVGAVFALIIKLRAVLMQGTKTILALLSKNGELFRPA